MRIWDKNGEERAYFHNCDHFGTEARGSPGPQLQHLKRFQINIEIQAGEEYETGRSAAKKVATALSGLGNLEFLELKLHANEGYYRVFKHFNLLRNVRTLVLPSPTDEFPDGYEKYAEYLRETITRSSTLDHLPKMYQALKAYAAPFSICHQLLDEAKEAADKDDVSKFKSAREIIVTMVTRHMDTVTGNLFEHDGNDVGSNDVGEDAGYEDEAEDAASEAGSDSSHISSCSEEEFVYSVRH